jgi:hypothetical protein
MNDIGLDVSARELVDAIYSHVQLTLNTVTYSEPTVESPLLESKIREMIRIHDDIVYSIIYYIYC